MSLLSFQYSKASATWYQYSNKSYPSNKSFVLRLFNLFCILFFDYYNGPSIKTFAQNRKKLSHSPLICSEQSPACLGKSYGQPLIYLFLGKWSYIVLVLQFCLLMDKTTRRKKINVDRRNSTTHKALLSRRLTLKTTLMIAVAFTEFSLTGW